MYDSPGLSRPGWMDDQEWSEYLMTEEARYELTYVPDEPGPYDYYDDRADDYADYMGEVHKEGYQDFYSGFYEDENPYGASDSGVAWADGWESAEKEYNANTFG